MLPDIHRATQKFYIFLIVYLTGCTPVFLFIVLFIFDIVPLVWILLLILLFCSRLDCTINKSKSITFYINQLALTYLPYNVL